MAGGMKLPAQSKQVAADMARLRDRRALARLDAAGEPFTVAAFCVALQAEFDREEVEASGRQNVWENST